MTSVGAPDAKRDEILSHLPYALGHVDAAIWALTLVSWGVRSNELSIHIAGEVIAEHESFAALTDAHVETGLIYCRKLIEFLGIRLDETTAPAKLVPVKTPRKKTTDACITQIGRASIVAVEEFLDEGPRDRAIIEEACAHTIRAAHRGVAHFTNTPYDKARCGKVVDCATTVRAAVERFAYRELGREVPNYRRWTPQFARLRVVADDGPTDPV
jgi:hypothetical protein